MASDETTGRRTVGFALGGLAGNNAHGAGFLQAALDADVVPDMISCTSGQIRWTFRYLQMLGAKRRGDVAPYESLKRILQDEIAEIELTPNRNLDLMALACRGVPGRFDVAGLQYVRDAAVNALDAGVQFARRWGNMLWPEIWCDLWPCRTFGCGYSRQFYQEVADAFAGVDSLAEQLHIGIAFNSFNPQTGEEHVFLNDSARDFLDPKREGTYQPRKWNKHRPRTRYQQIDANAVRKGLRLFNYGFGDDYEGFVDGAYFRDVILAELSPVTDIYVARPINHHWLGRLPRSLVDLEDMKTEMWFNGSYAGERAAIKFVNSLCDAAERESGGCAFIAQKYHRIELHEMEIETQRGYWDYVFEDADVFAQAYNAAMRGFRKKPPAPPADSAVPLGGRLASLPMT